MRKVIILSLLFCFSLLANIQIFAVVPVNKIGLIYDTDAANDDIIALIYLLAHPKIDLKAITIAGTGETHGWQGARNLADVCYWLKKQSVPIAYGRENSINGLGHSFPNFLRDMMDHVLVGKNIPHHPDPHISNKPVELIKSIVLSTDEKITILSTGPLTNVAEFIQKYPKLIKRLDKIVIMGGAVNVKGNIRALDPLSTNEVAEWNIYADPKAADIVFTSGVPVVLVPLDATNRVPMTVEFYETLSTESHPPLKLIYDLLKIIVDNLGLDVFIHEFYLWDALAAMITVDEKLAEIQSMPIKMDLQNAQTKLVAESDPTASMIKVSTSIPDPQSILPQMIKEIREGTQ